VAKKRSPIWRLALDNIWIIICLVGAGSCLALTVQLLLQAPPLDSPLLSIRLALGVPALFGTLAGVYGLVAGSLLALRKSRDRRTAEQLRRLQRRIEQLDALRRGQRTRLEELSALREVATVVNQESDFAIIAEKVLELIHGLLEPVESTIFLLDEERNRLMPFGQYTGGKFRGEGKALTRSMPEFELSEFESHSVICRVHGQELHAIVPLKVEEKIPGVLFMVWPTDARPAHEQVDEFNRTRRRVLQEITHHISLAAKTKYLQTKAVVDALTRLYSRTHFNTQIQAAIELAERTGERFSLIMADIDHFKHVNDRYGHDTGDVILYKVAKRIRDALRKYDTAYRYGGEEIAILLPRTSMAQAIGIGERLRRTVEQRKFRTGEGRLIDATISVGVAQFQKGDDAETLFKRADQQLYQAKETGRNRVCPAAA
jgi:diguanylate cyclase (GGDEF)-like protein